RPAESVGMQARIQFTPQAVEDLDTIWLSIAGENRDAADRVETEILATCHRLAKFPLIGSKREDITHLLVRFWTVTKFPNYVIVHRTETVPLQAVCEGLRRAVSGS